MLHVAANRRGTRGEQHREVFEAEQRALVVGLSRESHEAMSAQAGETVVDECFEIGVEFEQLESCGHFARHANVFACGFESGHGFISDFAGGERDVRMLLKVERELLIEGFGDDGREIEIRSEFLNDGSASLFGFEPQKAIGTLRISHRSAPFGLVRAYSNER